MAQESTMSLTPAGTRDRITLVLALPSFAAGSMDAIAFLVLGGVFTSAMSGNTILLGLAISQGHFSAAVHSFAALLGYVAGVSVASLSLAKSERGSGWTLGLEALFLAAFAALHEAGVSLQIADAFGYRVIVGAKDRLTDLR